MKRNKILFITLTLIVISVSTLSIFSPKLTEKTKYIEPVSIEITEEVEPEVIGAEGSVDEFVAESVYIPILNKEELFNDRDEWFDDYALACLPEYFNRYVTYYVELEPGIYEASYLDNSYSSHSHFPEFTLTMNLPDEQILVDCIYNPSTKRYVFKSKLNPERR